MRDLSWGEDDLIGEIERGSAVKGNEWYGDSVKGHQWNGNVLKGGTGV